MRAKVVFTFRLLTVFAVTLAAGNLFAEQATIPVVILVNDPTGTGVPGAIIRVVPSSSPSPKMETDGKGKLALDLKPGGYALFVRCPGFKSVATHIDVVETKMAETKTAEGRNVQTIPVRVEVGASGSPMVSPASAKDDLAVFDYPYYEPAALSPAAFKLLPHITVTFHNSHTNADETYSGVRLADILTKFNAPLGSELRGEALGIYVVATGSDGYSAVLALAEVDPAFHSGEVIVADEMNGKPLDAHSGPFKLIVTEDKRPARSVRNLVSIELKSAQ
jgi:hypothetical protein